MTYIPKKFALNDIVWQQPFWYFCMQLNLYEHNKDSVSLEQGTIRSWKLKQSKMDITLVTAISSSSWRYSFSITEGVKTKKLRQWHLLKMARQTLLRITAIDSEPLLRDFTVGHKLYSTISMGKWKVTARDRVQGHQWMENYRRYKLRIKKMTSDQQCVLNRSSEMVEDEGHD